MTYLKYDFVTLILGIVNMWFCPTRPWPGENINNFPCVSAQNNFSPCIFPLLYFFLWRFKKIMYHFILSNYIFYRIQKQKNSKLKREGRSLGNVLLPFFFPSLFFSMNIYEDSLFFLFLSHCFLYRDKYKNKKTRNWRGKAVVLETFMQILYNFFLSHCFLYRD